MIIKRGDSQPILKVIKEREDEEQTKKALESAKDEAKNVKKNGNNLESIENSK